MLSEEETKHFVRGSASTASDRKDLPVKKKEIRGIGTSKIVLSTISIDNQAILLIGLFWALPDFSKMIKMRRVHVILSFQSKVNLSKSPHITS